MEAGELLAFVLTVRSWLDSGYELLSCAAALELGVEQDEIAGHLAHGLDVATAVHWRDVAPDVNVRWQAVGSPEPTSSCGASKAAPSSRLSEP